MGRERPFVPGSLQGCAWQGQPLPYRTRTAQGEFKTASFMVSWCILFLWALCPTFSGQQGAMCPSVLPPKQVASQVAQARLPSAGQAWKLLGWEAAGDRGVETSMRWGRPKCCPLLSCHLPGKLGVSLWYQCCQQVSVGQCQVTEVFCI